MVYAVILAGGIGSRMGGDKPKQYLTVKDKPIIVYTIEKFFAVPQFEKIIVLCPKQWVEHTKNLIDKHIAPASNKIAVIEGGDTRNETIMNAIKFIESEGNLNDDTIIVTHDSVRPFVTNRIIEENIEFAKQYGACDTVVPATDTIVDLPIMKSSAQFLTEAKCIKAKHRSHLTLLSSKIFIIHLRLTKRTFWLTPQRFL